jgi:hypothetical protein
MARTTLCKSPLACSHRSAAAALRLALLCAAGTIQSCGGEDLGECDEAAAEQVVYSAAGLAATKGQALMHDSCGNGAFCHSSAASGSQRWGAPSQLNFDMMPPRGWPAVIERREEIWSSVTGGQMPPAGRGHDVLGDGQWSFGLGDDGADTLPAITTREGKAALRNWLACGAPVVGNTRVPIWALPPRDAGIAGETDWSTVFEQVVRPTCVPGCHSAASAGGLVMVDECEAYEQLLASATCGDAPRLVPGNESSFLLDKIVNERPACGQRMPPPPAPALSRDAVESITAWVAAGAPAQNCGAP